MLPGMLARATEYWAKHPLTWLRADVAYRLGVQLGLLTRVPVCVTSLCDLGFSQ